MPKEVFSSWYWVVSVLYALLGGVVALILPAITFWAAFYAGITTPMLVSTAAKHHKQGKVMVNERQDDFVRASEPKPRKGPPYELQAGRAYPEPQLSRWQAFVEVIRNHADGLFL